ncbi:MAG: thioredoxin domain-containing protein [Nocardioides sp.]
MAKSDKSKSERAKEMLRQQQRRERMRNLSVIAVVVVAVLVVVGVALYVQSNRDTTGKAAKDIPANLTGTYSVTIGQASAPTTVKLYEDLQCPICKQFEAATGQQVRAAIAAGKVKVEYHMVAFLDRSSTTQYSSRALNAAMAVLDTAGPDAFLKFHTLAYANQPAEGTAGVPDSTLIQWAVQAGADRSKVTPLINGNVYHQWVVNATDQMSQDGVNGTPTVYINGKEQNPDNPSAAAQALLAAVK